LGVKTTLIPLKSENKYHPEIDDIIAAVTPKTKAFLICNPANPTGTVFREEECKTIGDLAVDNDMAIFADEIYLHFVYDNNKFVSISSLSDEYKERTLITMSFSKTFSMTGWRLGFDIVPDKYLEKAKTLRAYVAPRPATFVFRMGTSCLKSDFQYVEERRVEYQKRRDYFCNAVNDLGWPCHLGEGSFYGWFNITSTNLGSKEFLAKLEEEQFVRLSPGVDFGDDNFIRVPLVQPIPVLKEVVERLTEFKSNL
jgi:aspartate/methionine/tyrosine aminotransferase